MKQLEQLFEYLVKDLQGLVCESEPALLLQQDDLSSALLALQSFDFGPLGPSQLVLNIVYDNANGMVKLDMSSVDFSCVGFDKQQVCDLLLSIKK